MSDTAGREVRAFELPDVVRRYQDAHDRPETDVALSTFARDATVVDDGREFRGSEQIRDWLIKAATEFSYTRTLVSAELADADTWLLVNHLEGDFPGGTVDLRYRFTVSGDLISELVIAP